VAIKGVPPHCGNSTCSPSMSLPFPTTIFFMHFHTSSLTKTSMTMVILGGFIPLLRFHKCFHMGQPLLRCNVIALNLFPSLQFLPKCFWVFFGHLYYFLLSHPYKNALVLFYHHLVLVEVPLALISPVFSPCIFALLVEP